MTIQDDIALLERVPTFAPLGREALRIIAIGAESRSMQEGAVLFRIGDVADCGYVVETGSFKLVSGHEHVLPVVVRRGALLGELSLLTETRRPVTATAQELSLVMRIMRPLFLKMLDGYPEVAERLRQIMLARTEELTDELSRVRHVFPAVSVPEVAKNTPKPSEEEAEDSARAAGQESAELATDAPAKSERTGSD